jgi:16S rRNA (uracil1498-N3)-methyltransferase
MANLGRAPRFYLEGPLAAELEVELDADRAHQLRHVLRLAPGATVRLFNAESGEWWGRLTRLDRGGGGARIVECLRPPEPTTGPRLALAPIRANRLDWSIEKAVELGVGAVDLVLTQRTVVRPARIDRLRAVAVEAAEQCGRLSVPRIGGPIDLEAWLEGLAPGTRVVMADEEGGESVLATLRQVPDAVLLVGPEGGFAPDERRRLAARPGVFRVGLGPRILRSETAALFLLVAHELALAEVRPGRP